MGAGTAGRHASYGVAFAILVAALGAVTPCGAQNGPIQVGTLAVYAVCTRFVDKTPLLTK